MTTHDCGKPNCAGICAAGLTETHRRQKDVATGYEDGIAEGRRQMAEEAAAIAAEHCGPRRSWEGMSGALTRIRALVPR